MGWKEHSLEWNPQMTNIVGNFIEKGFTLFSKFRVSSFDVYKEFISVDPTAVIDPSAHIKIFNPPTPPETCLEIDENSHIFSQFNLMRPAAKIRIGKRCQLGNSHFVCTDRIEIGDDVIMAWGSTLMDSDNHSIYWNERCLDVDRCRNDYLSTAGLDIGRNHDWSLVKTKKICISNKSWIGMNCIILKGVTIGEGSIIGAGSVVTRDVPAWHMAAGNPAKIITRNS